MRRKNTPPSPEERLAAVLAENRRLRAETQQHLDSARLWSQAVAHNIHDAPRWVWHIAPHTNERSDDTPPTR